VVRFICWLGGPVGLAILGLLLILWLLSLIRF
jgi:hypothetical protein